MTSPTRLGLAVRRAALFAGGAVASIALTGCAGSGSVKSASIEPDQIAAKADKLVAKAELAVQRAPRDAGARAALGQAYLAAGRFESATTALDDAMKLGDNSGRTALGLALAKIGSGHGREAVALLDDWRAEIPASDLGLALALAGETSRGVAVLSDAVRGGENTPKLRQNLAYAYALDGRWAEARIIAAQDVPADQLERRLASWALSALPDRNQDRVAGLIGTTVRPDGGQPEQLALAADATAQQVAVETPGAVSASPAETPAAIQQAAAQPAQELPALAAANEAPSTPVVEQNRLAQARPAATPAPLAARPSVASAFAPLVKPAHAAARARTGATLVAASRPQGPQSGTHLVQLGSFSSPQGARRAWGIFVQRNPALSDYRMTITAATVSGKNYWRVAAAGFSGQGAASGLCAQVKARGGACFAYAAPSHAAPVPGAPLRDMSGPQRARR